MHSAHAIGSSTRARGASGFARIELLVCGIIIGNLAILVAPALSKANRKTQSTLCFFNLRAIVTAARLYANENSDALYFRRAYEGGPAFAPNGGKWTSSPLSTNELSADAVEAYWGIAYRPYTRQTRQLWRCPAAKTVDEWRDAGFNYPAEFWLNSTYGLERFGGLSILGGIWASSRQRVRCSGEDDFRTGLGRTENGRTG